MVAVANRNLLCSAILIVNHVLANNGPFRFIPAGGFQKVQATSLLRNWDPQNLARDTPTGYEVKLAAIQANSPSEIEGHAGQCGATAWQFIQGVHVLPVSEIDLLSQSLVVEI